MDLNLISKLNSLSCIRFELNVDEVEKSRIFLILSIYCNKNYYLMFKSIYLAYLFIFGISTCVFSQERPIKIVDETENNRILIYAINENEYDLDVSIEIEGWGFRQRAGVPRMYRVPKASKVNIASLIVERGMKAAYTYKLKVNDSLSRRVVRNKAIPVKIDPRKNILVYLKEGCTSCDSLVSKLDNSYYNYRKMVLSKNPEVKEFLINTFRYTETPFDSIDNPIVSLGGTLYTEIETYEQLLQKLNGKEEEDSMEKN